MDMDLELVASFVALVDEWHFGRAASELFLTTSALTKRIQRLERVVGVTLVDRGPEGLTGLTPAGLQFAAAARPLVRQARQAVEDAHSASGQGVLRVGLPSGTTALLPAMAHLATCHELLQAVPDRRVSLVEIPFPLINRCLPEGSVDVLLTIAPVSHSEVASTPLPMTSTRIAIVSERHSLAGAGEVTMAEMCEQQLLYNPDLPEEWMRPFWLGDLQTRAEARLASTHASNHNRVYHDLRMGSYAMITLIPAREVLPRHLQAVELKGAEALTIYAASRRRDRRSGAHAYVAGLRALPPRALS